jgi:hypothetical protein
MKKVVVVIVLLLTAAGMMWAQRAVVREVRGTVETRRPGEGEWQAAKAGQELEAGSMVSTGFRSGAVLELGGSVLEVRPLTRLSLGELEARAGTERINIRLQAGRVRAEVRAPGEGDTEFTVRSPMAVASVRGTAFEFDTVNLIVDEGTVSFSGMDETAVNVGAGQSSYPEAVSGRTTIPAETAFVLAPPPPAGVEEVAASSPAIIPGPPAIAPVTLELRW